MEGHGLSVCVSSMTVVENPDDTEPQVRNFKFEKTVRVNDSDIRILICFLKFSRSTSHPQKKNEFKDILEVAASPTGIHPKMRSIMIFDNVSKKVTVEEIGGDIGKDKRRRRNPQTWRDSTKNTLYLD